MIIKNNHINHTMSVTQLIQTLNIFVKQSSFQVDRIKEQENGSLYLIGETQIAKFFH